MKNSLIYPLALASTILLAACRASEQPATSSTSGTVTLQNNQNKISLDEAYLDQMEPYIFECKHRTLCVQICHRPPGNPENSKTLDLPLQATVAHLNHGGEHEDKDYIGPCDASSGGPAAATGDDTTDDTTDDTAGGGSTVPLWCQAFLSIDANCDGLNDQTGFPYL